MKAIKIKRIYNEVPQKGSYRILVDRIWPRGISKEKAQLDEWMKEIAPSTELRKWFNHEEDKFEEFTKRYKQELKEQSELLSKIKEIAQKSEITLLYGAKDEQHNQAVVLKDFLTQ